MQPREQPDGSTSAPVGCPASASREDVNGLARTGQSYSGSAPQGARLRPTAWPPLPSHPRAGVVAQALNTHIKRVERRTRRWHRVQWRRGGKEGLRHRTAGEAPRVERRSVGMRRAPSNMSLVRYAISASPARLHPPAGLGFGHRRSAPSLLEGLRAGATPWHRGSQRRIRRWPWAKHRLCDAVTA